VRARRGAISTTLVRRRFVQIAGGPDWIDSNRFDISASANATVTSEQMHTMMRTLLADRFKLACHMETQQLPIYAMRLARADGRLGNGLKKAAEDAKGRFREQLGLKLEATRGPVNVLVIDRAEKPSTD